MKELRCMVVDDEPLAVKMLENFISKTSFLSLEASFTDPVAALEAIRTQRPQLVFLDIQMPDLNGMELSRMIPEGTRVIFTTAFKDYAFDSYEVSALDFLLKPIRYQKFLEAAEKARQWFTLVAGAEAAETVPDGPAQQDSIFVKSEGQLRKVAFSDIQYVEGMKDYVLLHICSEKRPLVTHITMKAVEELLPAGAFMRVHRSYIVALDKIDSVSGTNDISIGDTFIHVSDAYRVAFEEYLSQRMLR
ncbi:MAG: LytTR family DNA-binding domain-containing protein [Bacteroidales bacterium]|nr:LytTR family DNA-binding domain-containing protein [Bacteroidales bacterium]